VAMTLAFAALITSPVWLPPRRCRVWYRARYTRESQRSARIGARLRRRVLAADRHRCVSCHRRDELQIEHVMPWSLGGLSWWWNLVTLCGDCNRVKSNYWRFRDGYVVYRAFEGYGVPGRAAAILARERRARRNPLRWLRAAWAI